MKFDITGRHIDVTPAIRAHVETQFSKIDNVFDGKAAKAHVIIEVERGRHRSEIIVNWRSDVLTAMTTDSDMYNSISLTIDKIEKQARKIKEKITDKAHKAIKVATLEPKEPTAG